MHNTVNSSGSEVDKYSQKTAAVEHVLAILLLDGAFVGVLLILEMKQLKCGEIKCLPKP